MIERIVDTIMPSFMLATMVFVMIVMGALVFFLFTGQVGC